MDRFTPLSCCLIAALSAAAGAARADPVEDFYRGRAVKLVIGANTGGAYDAYGRLLAAHLGRHIPGHPTIVPSNMPGASGGQSAIYLHAIAEKKVNVLVQIGLNKEPDLPDVPLLIDLARTPVEQAIFRFVSSDSAMGFPVVAPPGVPAERVAALRRALLATLADPALAADAQKRGLPIHPVAGEDVQQVVAALIATPKDVLATLKRTI